MPSLLDLIGARSPQAAQNTLDQILQHPMAQAALQYMRDAAPGGVLNQEWTPENVRTAGEVASMMPNPAGDVISGMLAIDDLRKGDYGSAGLNAAGLLPFVPSLGLIKDIPAPKWLKDKFSVPVGINPTSSEMKELFREEDALRVIQTKDGQMYVWPASQGLHQDIGAFFKLDPRQTEHGLIVK